MKCICGASFRNKVDYHRHYTSPIHRNTMNTKSIYIKCHICYSHHISREFFKCRECKNKVCKNCYTEIFYTGDIRCPFCRNTEF